MKPRKEQTLRCAIYTIKSSEEGLPLIGKLFDEAGEGLTPTQRSKVIAGTGTTSRAAC
jgi:hypothetical protein